MKIVFGLQKTQRNDHVQNVCKSDVRAKASLASVERLLTAPPPPTNPSTSSFTNQTGCPPSIYSLQHLAMSIPKFQISPPPTSFAKLSFPAPYTLLVILSRPKSLNCINSAGHQELHKIWTWLDNEPSLRVGIVTGEGRAFCAGADLKGTTTNSTISVKKTPPSISPMAAS